MPRSVSSTPSPAGAAAVACPPAAGARRGGCRRSRWGRRDAGRRRRRALRQSGLRPGACGSAHWLEPRRQVPFRVHRRAAELSSMFAIVAASSTFAMKSPGAFSSTPRLYDQCICQRPSRPGDDRMVLTGSGAAPFRSAVLDEHYSWPKPVHERKRTGRDGAVTARRTSRSTVPSGLFGHINSSSLVRHMSPEVCRTELPQDDHAADRLGVVRVDHPGRCPPSA